MPIPISVSKVSKVKEVLAYLKERVGLHLESSDIEPGSTVPLDLGAVPHKVIADTIAKELQLLDSTIKVDVRIPPGSWSTRVEKGQGENRLIISEPSGREFVVTRRAGDRIECHSCPHTGIRIGDLVVGLDHEEVDSLIGWRKIQWYFYFQEERIEVHQTRDYGMLESALSSFLDLSIEPGFRNDH